MEYDYNLEEIKESLSLDNIEEILIEFNAEPERRNETIISRTVCHGGDSAKLYYYNNTGLFHCYTGCSDPTFDIFELVRKVMSREHPKPREDSAWNLPEAVDWVARKFGYAPNIKEDNSNFTIKQDLTILQNYDRIKEINVKTQEIELKEYQAPFLQYLPKPHLPWEQEGIKKNVIDNHNICYDPSLAGIIIPHYDIDNRLIGIRVRNLAEDAIEKYGKYRPAYIGGKMYNHPLSLNLYNLNYSKENIRKIKKAIIFESEKSCLKYASYFGPENDISVASCGSNVLKYQFWLLHNLGAEEIIIAYDRQYKKIGDGEYQLWIKKLIKISQQYKMYCNITFIFDTQNLLDYKDAPVDKGEKIFLQLFKERLDNNGYQFR